jgi:hypothetical protein
VAAGVLQSQQASQLHVQADRLTSCCPAHFNSTHWVRAMSCAFLRRPASTCCPVLCCAALCCAAAVAVRVMSTCLMVLTSVCGCTSQRAAA